MTPPAVVIRFELEARPVVTFEARNEAEHTRLLDWHKNRPEQAALILRALELERQEIPA